MSVFGVSRMMGGYGFGMMGLYWFLSVLMLLAAIVLVIWAILHMKPFGSLAQHEPYDRAVEVLRERYARGESAGKTTLNDWRICKNHRTNAPCALDDGIFRRRFASQLTTHEFRHRLLSI